MRLVGEMLRDMRQKPSLYLHPLFQPIREFCEYRDNHRGDFSGLIGETLPLQPVNPGEVVRALTRGYIQAIAEYDDTTKYSNPILQVVSKPDTKFRKVPFKKVFNKEQQPVKVTHLRLLDGDNNQMLGRCAINVTDDAKKLKAGDIIRLELYTELTHTLNEAKGAPPKPVVYIIKFSLVGRNSIPPATSINDPLECEASSMLNKSNGKSIHLDNIEQVKCDGCCCLLYGIRMLVCVCNTNPIDKINLETLKDECWFADKDVCNMENNEKRCMLYWWFATNIYGICGSKNRAPLPVCLVASVRKQYPAPDGKYKGYEAYQYIGADPNE